MDIFLSVFEIFVDIHEYALIVLFLAATLGFKNGKPLLPCIVAAAILLFQITLSHFVTIPYLTAWIFGVIDIIYAMIFFEGSRTKQIFMGIMPSIVFLSSEAVSISVFTFFIPIIDIIEPSLYRFGAQVAYVCINVSSTLVLASFFRKKETSGYLPRRQMIVMTLMIVPTIYLILMLTNLSIYEESAGNSKLSAMCTISTVLLASVAAGIYVLFRSVSKTYAQSLDRERELQKLELERQHYTDMSELYEKLRIWKHDSLNRIRTFEYLMQNNDSDEVRSFIEKATGEVQSIENLINTAHPVIDAVVSSELAKAKRAGVTISPVIILPDYMPFDDMDLCTVISNLIDNAIEAVQKLEKDKRYIAFEMTVQAKSLIISVVNPSDGAYSKGKNGFLFTTKKESDSHGLGMKIVSSTVERMNGVVEFIPNKDKFDATVILPLMEVKAL